MKITCIVGTRPEFVKMFPVVAELRRRGESPTIIATGQHTDLLRGTPFEDGMAPHVVLKLASTNDPIHYAGVVHGTLLGPWTRNRPDMVIVQGDTASAYAGALAASQLNIPIAHVEAGIRSNDPDDPWPEEIFRASIDKIAKMQFAPTEHCRSNLLNETFTPGAEPDLIGPTGNTGIDALYSHTKPIEQSQKVDRVLITLHRRESFGEPLANMIWGIFAAGAKHPHLKFVWPTHPNPRVQSQLAAQWERTPLNVHVRGPLDTVEFAQMLATSRAVITDSGGVQEEAAALGVPAIIARTRTDRPESVELGLAKVVGRSEEGILQGLEWALDARCEPSDCFGDGHAAPRIVQHLLA